MSIYKLIFLSMFFFVLAACGESAPTVGEAAEFAGACDKANDGKRIAIEGFLRFPDSFTGDQSVVLRLYETGQLDGKPVGVQTRFGGEANQVEMVPDQYSDDDLKVHVAGGQLAQFGTKVKVSGKVYYPLVEQDFDCGLENPLVELAN